MLGRLSQLFGHTNRTVCRHLYNLHNLWNLSFARASIALVGRGYPLRSGQRRPRGDKHEDLHLHHYQRFAGAIPNPRRHHDDHSNIVHIRDERALIHPSRELRQAVGIFAEPQCYMEYFQRAICRVVHCAR